ncbi:MAG: helix-turn-helix domain-containing protein [Archangiaceae bacterium]|nr:helix-turn-helix domain-containing protein [Archangiaceae bacterium]
MKPFQLQSYYELLEVPVSATTEQIRRAFERLNAMYADDQVALYGLVEAGSASQLRARLQEAMEILCDDDLRLIYDNDLGLPPRVPVPPRRDEEDDEQSSAQLAMNELLTGADRALQSTHPYVPFSYVSSVEAPPPPTPPPAVVVAPPASVPPPLAVLPDATPTPPPPPAVTTSAQPPPLPPVLSGEDHPERSREAAESKGAPSPPIEPVIAAPERPAAPFDFAQGEPLPVPSAPPPAASAPLAPPSAPAPRPSPAQAPQLAEAAAIAVAESQLARVSAAVDARDARASAPRPKPPDLPPDTEFNGEVLRKVRTAMGISLQQISEKTRISARHLEGIEADRYAALPAPVYLRGILMNLARELGLDGLKVSKSYLQLVEKAKG